MTMELIPESAQADDRFGPFLLGDEDVADRLRASGHLVAALVPECVGLSLSLVEHGITFTVASSSTTTSVLDAVQYLDDGPCLRAMDTAEVLAWPSESTDSSTDSPGSEESWHAYAAACAARGVASSLSLPIVLTGSVVGGFNLYASTPHAFDAHHHQLAGLLGAWAGGATTNADLGFATRDVARRAPQILQDSLQLSLATATIARVLGCDHATAVERLHRAAEQSAVPLPTLADNVIRIFQAPEA